MSANSIAVDTTSLLTLLGLIAAVWAIIPQKSQLNFRLRVSSLDWLVILGVFIFIHVLVFEDVLKNLNLFYSFGPLWFGLDKNGAIYLSLLCLVIFILIRSKTTKLDRRNINIFENLFNNLLLTKQYNELAILLNQHIKTVFAISDMRNVRGRISKKIRPASPFTRFFTNEKNADGWLKTTFPESLNYLADKLEINGHPEKIASGIVKKLLATQHLTAYLAVAYPYLCIEILKEPATLRGEFSDDFMQELIKDETSIFYAELKNNHNLSGHHRYDLPEENKLLNFFFSDIGIAAKFGVYRGVGETVCQIIDSDSKLSENYNGPLGYYDEVGSFKCPIFCGIHFFEIMILEGLHQHSKDHLWLFYVTHFTDKIVNQLRPYKEDDDNHEFPSVFQYLLYKIVSANINWIEEAQYIDNNAPLDENGNGYIAFQAVSAFGKVINTIISSENLGDRFKQYILEIALTRIATLQRVDRMKILAQTLQTAIIHPDNFWKSNEEYKANLLRLYEELDHVLQMDTSNFEEKLTTAINEP